MKRNETKRNALLFFVLPFSRTSEQALPDAEEWLRNNLIVAVGSMIISAPGKVLKGTVNTVHSIATKSIRGAGGLVNTTGVSEATGPGAAGSPSLV